MPLTSTVETFSLPLQFYDVRADAEPGTRPDFVMPPKRAARFPRMARLLRHADFEHVYKQGRRHFSASMTFFYLARTEPTVAMQAKTRAGVPAPHGLRVGFTVGRALGGAVQRNRMKRRLREAVRMALPVNGVAADVVINPKRSLLSVDFSGVRSEVSRAFAIIEQKLAGKASEKLASDSSANRVAESRGPDAESRS